MLHVIGIGPGRPEWIPTATHDIVAQCEVVVGSSRALKLFPEVGERSFRLSGDMGQTLELIRDQASAHAVIGVLVSGDPGFFSLLSALKREFPEAQITVHPGLSSVQFAFARAGIPWQEAVFVSVHGRDLAGLPRGSIKPMAVLTGGANTPQKVAQLLLERGVNPRISVGNALGYPEEVWESLDAEHLARYPQKLEQAVVIIHPADPLNSGRSNSLRIGIPDREFIRGEVPMTKAEIRVQVLA